MTTREFIDHWDALRRDQPGVNKKFFPNLALEIRVGRDVSGREMIAIKTPRRLVEPPELTGLSIVTSTTESGIHWLVLSLLDPTAVNEFAVLCQDLVDQVEGTSSVEAGLNSLLGCLGRWKNLFLPNRRRLLSDEKLRALMAELVALRFLGGRPGLELATAARAWVGPMRAPQDFQFEASFMAYEVKATHRDNAVVTIASEAQLESESYEIYLLLVQIEDLGPNEVGGVRIVDIVKRILTDLQSDLSALNMFETGLQELGFSLAEEAYQDKTYAVDQVRSFGVNTDFPRLTRAKLPQAITGVKYQLDSSQLHDFLDLEEQINTTDLT